MRNIFQSILKNNSEALPIVKANCRTFAFVHINKTGGTSIAQAIGLKRKVHYTACELKQMMGGSKWKKAYKFSFVRNPWYKVVSHYKYRVQTNQTMMREIPIDFSDWVKVTYSPNKDSYYYNKPRMFMPQVEWLRDEKGKICFDMIGRFEYLESDFRKLVKLLGIDVNLPHLNRTPKTFYRDFYCQSTRIIIADWFTEDIAYFH